MSDAKGFAVGASWYIPTQRSIVCPNMVLGHVSATTPARVGCATRFVRGVGVEDISQESSEIE